MVYMSHNNNHRRTGLEVVISILNVLEKTLFNRNNDFLLNLSAKLLCDK